MIEFGYTLRTAREAKGLTTRQIAEKTHMMVQMVEDLENENFAKIAAPIYGRGFVKLYCEVVGIDPKPLIAEFMDIYNGNRPPTIRMREEPEPAPAPAPAPEPEPVRMPEPIQELVREPAPAPTPEPEQIPAPGPAPVTEPEPQAEVPPAFETPFTLESEQVPAATPSVFAAEEPPAPAQPAFTSHGPSRYAAPLPIEDKEMPRFSLNVPPAVWRLLVLALAACLILWLLLTGIRALYRATMTPPSEPEAVAEQQPAQKPSVQAVPAAPATGPRKPMDLPPLYID